MSERGDSEEARVTVPIVARTGRPRTVRGMRAAVAPVLVGMLAPVGLYFWYVAHFGVNVPFQDTWNGTLPLLRAFSSGTLSLAALWAPHNENRMLIPNLLSVLLDNATHMNEHIDMLVSAVLLTLALLIICWLAWHTLQVPLHWLIPVPWLVLGLAQVQNALWAFQLAWVLIILCAAASLLAIELAPLRPSFVALACALALVASFSSLQGLLVWPAGLVYGLACGWRWTHASVWLGVAAAATAIYFWPIGPAYATPDLGYLPAHPLLSFRFFLSMFGAIFVGHRTILGAAVLVLSLMVLFFIVRTRGNWRRCRLPLALGSMSLLFNVVVTEGRVQFGLGAATASRYTTYNLLFLAAVYLGAVVAAGPPRSVREALDLPHRRAFPGIVLAAAGLAVFCQLAWGVPNGLYQGQAYYVNRSIGAKLLLEYQNHSAAVLGQYLFYTEGPYVKRWAPVLKSHQWSVFSSRH